MSWIIKKIKERMFTRPVEREIDPDEILDEIKSMDVEEAIEVLDKVGYGHLEGLLNDNPFILDRVSESEPEDILEFCREELGIEDEEECFTSDNIENYIRQAYGTVYDLFDSYPGIFNEILDAYRGYFASELIVKKLYELMDEGKFNPRSKRDIEALKRVIQRFPFSEVEKEEMESYIMDELGIRR